MQVCDAKTQTVKTELNKRLPSTAICNGSFAVGRVPPGGADGPPPPAGHLTQEAHQAPSNPALSDVPTECSFPGKPSTVRAGDCM